MRSLPLTNRFDLAVVGAGILGLATAREALNRGLARTIVVLEKEDGAARHQTGRNSGVIHSGLYYSPGSAKARFCVEGRTRLLDYCAEREIPFRITGKLVVATEERELEGLETLRTRGEANGLRGLEVLDEHGIREHEPAVRGLRALRVRETGVVDFRVVAARFEEDLRARGAKFRFGAAARDIAEHDGAVRIRTRLDTIEAERVVVCAGVHADEVAQRSGGAPTPGIVPFRGDFWSLRPERAHLVRGSVYPVPDPRFPFLGVHFTRGVADTVLVGPNAVFAFGREAYGRADFNLQETIASFAHPGFRTLAARNWRTGLGEMVRDWWRPAFVSALRRFIPELRDDDLVAGPSGIRAQAINLDGSLLDDFAFDTRGRVLHVRNAPSPAATSSLALARELVDRLSAL